MALQNKTSQNSKAQTVVRQVNTLVGYEYLKSLDQGFQLVHIVDVQCPKCLRKFRTVPSVVEHAGWVYCAVCGTRMNISEPKPVSALSEKGGSTAA
ncbi:MAG TPA: hypothetical protein VGK24_19830 [Candidatus Angelobacter sp.]|jgi:uncharacterized Zn finger protein (UPF0148 family)